MNVSLWKKHWQKAVCVFAVLAAFVIAILGTTVWAADAAELPGAPYDDEGNYDVTIPHILVNQVYGGSDDGYASHSFIELYNPMEQDVFLEGWSVQYRSSEDGAQADAWAKYDLHGTIRAKITT